MLILLGFRSELSPPCAILVHTPFSTFQYVDQIFHRRYDIGLYGDDGLHGIVQFLGTQVNLRIVFALTELGNNTLLFLLKIFPITFII